MTNTDHPGTATQRLIDSFSEARAAAGYAQCSEWLSFELMKLQRSALEEVLGTYPAARIDALMDQLDSGATCAQAFYRVGL